LWHKTIFDWLAQYLKLGLDANGGVTVRGACSAHLSGQLQGGQRRPPHKGEKNWLPTPRNSGFEHSGRHQPFPCYGLPG
jgi:hypothetical protein